jgi:hypothetical protein
MIKKLGQIVNDFTKIEAKIIKKRTQNMFRVEMNIKIIIPLIIRPIRGMYYKV